MKHLALKRSILALALVAVLACAAFTVYGATQEADDDIVIDAYSLYEFTTQEQLIADTAHLAEKLYSNPHDSHYGLIATCAVCHEAGDDGTSLMWCTSCHIGMDVPEGWLPYPSTLWEAQ